MNFLHRDDENLSELVDIGKFHKIHEGSTLLPRIPFLPNGEARKAEIFQIMSACIDDDYLDKLMIYCEDSSEEHEDSSLSSCQPSLKYIPKKIPPEGEKFHTIRKLKERIVKDSTYSCKNLVKRSNSIQPMDNFEIPSTEPDLVPGENVLIKIKIYGQHAQRTKKFNQSKLSHDIVVLGSHTLDLFRDQIRCPNSVGAVEDMSNNPDLSNITLAKDVFKSGFLIINETFYNDARCSDNIDYSESIIKWAQNKKCFPKFKTACMENTAFNDLKVRFGQPQVYVHHGNCEHIFVFSDIEILKPSDICYSGKYPYCSSLIRNKTVRCNICGLFMARWLVTESDRVPFNPAYFCESCFRSYNYIGDKKVGNFKAYPFIDKNWF